MATRAAPVPRRRTPVDQDRLGQLVVDVLGGDVEHLRQGNGLAATSRHAFDPVEPGPTPYWYQVGRSNRFAVHSGPARCSRSVSHTSFTKTGVSDTRIDRVNPPMLSLPSSARSMIEISSEVWTSTPAPPPPSVGGQPIPGHVHTQTVPQR